MKAKLFRADPHYLDILHSFTVHDTLMALGYYLVILIVYYCTGSIMARTGKYYGVFACDDLPKNVIDWTMQKEPEKILTGIRHDRNPLFADIDDYSRHILRCETAAAEEDSLKCHIFLRRNSFERRDQFSRFYTAKALSSG